MKSQTLVKKIVFSLVMFFTLLSFTLSSCGQAGEGDLTTVDGVYDGMIVTNTGLFSLLNGWQLVLSEAETKICKLSSINNGGFSFTSVDKSKNSTILVLTPESKLHAVLSIPNTKEPTKVYQYFKSEEQTLPPLILKYPVLNFIKNTSKDNPSLKIASYFATSSQGDGIPDGLRASTQISTISNEDAVLSAYSQIGSTLIDTDLDGLPNIEDFDILGDGVPDLFTTDTDHDGIIDIFDIDANADLIQDDLQPKANKYYFHEIVEYISVQQRYLSSSKSYSIKMSLKLQENVPLHKVTEVSIVSNTDLFAGTTDRYLNSWDYTLTNEGLEDDEMPNDLVFAKIIPTAIHPNNGEIIFFKVVVDNQEYYFPYIFSKLEFNPITPIYNTQKRIITLSNFTPFGSKNGAENFIWSVWVYNTSGTTVFSSEILKGRESLSYKIPDSVSLDPGYKIKIFAQSYDQVAGTPAVMIESEELVIN